MQTVAEVVADPLFPRYETAAVIVEALNGSLAEVMSLCDNVTTLGLPPIKPLIYAVDRVDEIDDEICLFARYLASKASRIEMPEPVVHRVVVWNATGGANGTVRALFFAAERTRAAPAPLPT